jgi:biopolymer transport protein ExbD
MVTKEELLVDGRSVGTLAQVEASPDAVFAPLKAALQSQADKVLAGAAKDDIKEREVTILGDRNTPYKVLRKIMATATDAEYGKVSLAVIEREGGAVPATARTASLTN